jgi:hypothetical protein
MAITKRPAAKPEKSIEDFIGGAPDSAPAAPAAAKAKGVMKGHQRQISLAMPVELIARMDAAAGKLSLTRAGFLKLAVTRAVEAEQV